MGAESPRAKQKQKRLNESNHQRPKSASQELLEQLGSVLGRVLFRHLEGGAASELQPFMVRWLTCWDLFICRLRCNWDSVAITDGCDV